MDIYCSSIFPRATCLTALLAATPFAYSFDGSLIGCNIKTQVDGNIGPVGASNQLSSLTGLGGVNTTFELQVTDNQGADFHVGTPVVTRDGTTTVPMIDSTEGVFYITDSVEGYSRTQMTSAGLFFSKGKSQVQIEYTGESSTTLEAGPIQ